MSLNDESYLDSLLKSVTTEESGTKKKTALEILEETGRNEGQKQEETSIQTEIEDQPDISANDLEALLKSLEQIEESAPIEISAEMPKEEFSDIFADDTEEPIEENYMEEKAEERFELEELLNSLEEVGAETEQDIAQDRRDEEDVSELLSAFGEDEALSEVNELLQKDENHEVVDDDILEMLEGKEASGDDAEGTSEGAASKKRLKKRGFGKKKKQEEEISDTKKKEKKPGLWNKLLAALFETEEEEEGTEAPKIPKPTKAAVSEATQENLEVLKELEEEDSKGKKKRKGKKEKEKKPKKEKKGKEPKELKAPDKKEKKISKKKMIRLILFNLTLLAAILIMVIFVPKSIAVKDAKRAFAEKNYMDVYTMLAGMKLDDDSEEMYVKATIILELQRKFDSFENYQKMDMPMEALHSLLQGVNRFDKLLPFGEEYQIQDELETTYQQILDALQTNYGLSEEDVRKILSYDKVTYTKKLDSMVNGTEFADPENPVQNPVTLEDMLPEEEALLQEETQTEQVSEQVSTDASSVSANEAQQEQGGAGSEDANGKVLYSGTIQDGKVMLSKEPDGEN